MTDKIFTPTAGTLEAPGAAYLKTDRDRAVECARNIMRGNYAPGSGPYVVADYLLRTLGLAPF